MSTNTTIAISVISALIIGVMIHKWLHKLLTFKMDEGAITNCFRENKIAHPASIADIACAAMLSEARTLAVCQASTQLTLSNNDLWDSKF